MIFTKEHHNPILVIIFLILFAFLIYYVASNTTYVDEIKDIRVISKTFKPSYTSHHTRTIYDSDGNVAGYENYTNFHQEEYWINVSDGCMMSNIEDGELFHKLNNNQTYSMLVTYMCWKNEKKRILSIKFMENI